MVSLYNAHFQKVLHRNQFKNPPHYKVADGQHIEVDDVFN